LEVISLLQDLLRVQSVCGNEEKIAHFIVGWMKENGLPAEMVEVMPKRPNVIAQLKGASPGPHVMLNGHMDTVDAGRGWTHDPFGCEIEEGRMYGRGAYDMKSGLASILWAAAACKQEGLPRRGKLTLAAVVDEEAIDLGTYALIQQGYTKGLDIALVAESTDLKVVTAHRGRAIFEIEVSGRAAHSQSPSHGVNAIEKAAILLNALPQLAGPVHPKIGTSTVSILRIEGGQEQVMLIPDRCRVVVERCLVPGYSTAEALDDMKQLIGKLGISADVALAKRDTPFCEPFEIPETDPYVRLIVESVEKTLARKTEITFHEGPCDSCILVNQGNVPTIEFGPSGGQLHEADEYVDIESVRTTANVYREILRRLLS